MTKWKDIKRCLWCWCCRGTQEDSDSEEEESRRVKKKERIKKKKRNNKIGPKQERGNTHGLKATFIKSDVDLDEPEISCKPVAPLNKSALDEACEEHIHVPREETKDSCSRPLEIPVNKSVLDEACEELLHVLLDETEESDNPPLETQLKNSVQGEASCSRSPSRISHQTRITLEHFTFHKVLGKGSYGKVFLAELKGSEAWFAVKALKKDKMLKKKNVEYPMVEKRVLALAWDNPFLTHLYSTFQTKEHLFFVMEYQNGGDLKFHLKLRGRFDLKRATFYAAEIVCGLQFLHGKGIIHRDLKLGNVMLDGEGHIKLADFGICKENISGRNLATSFCGTPQYMAPEIIRGNRYSFSVDWWSFGVLVYMMLIGKHPFTGDDKLEIYKSVCRGKPHLPSSITWNARNMLKRLFRRDPFHRLGVVGNIRRQLFFWTINWSALERREIEPPYKPNMKSPNDCRNVDRKYLRELPLMSQCEKGVGDSMDQNAFAGFSFINQSMEHLQK